MSHRRQVGLINKQKWFSQGFHWAGDSAHIWWLSFFVRLSLSLSFPFLWTCFTVCLSSPLSFSTHTHPRQSPLSIHSETTSLLPSLSHFLSSFFAECGCHPSLVAGEAIKQQGRPEEGPVRQGVCVCVINYYRDIRGALLQPVHIHVHGGRY